MPSLWVNTKYSIHQVQHTPSAAYTKYIIHQVQHTPSTAYTKYSIHQVQHTPSTAYTKYSFHPRWSVFTSFSKFQVDPEMQLQLLACLPKERLPPATSPWQLTGKVTWSHSHSCESTNWLLEPQYLAHLLSTASGKSTNSNYASNLAQSWPWSATLIMLNYGLHMYLQTRSIIISHFANPGL